MGNRKTKFLNSRPCHGCGGTGIFAVTEPEHWEDSGAADTKARRVRVSQHTRQETCIRCEGEGILVDENGSTTIRKAGQASKVLMA